MAVGSRLPGETVLAGQGIVETRQGVEVFVTALDVHEGWDVVLTRANATAVIEAHIAIDAESYPLDRAKGRVHMISTDGRWAAPAVVLA